LSAGIGSEDKVQGADADQEHEEGFRKVSAPARAQVECPPSLAALFHPHLTTEENLDSLHFSSRGQHHLKTHRHAHSSPSPSPVHTVVKSDVFSDSHDTLLPTPSFAYAPPPTRTPTPTPISRLPSLLTRKPSTCKSQSGTGGNKAPKSHNVKRKSTGLVEEVFGVGFAAGRGRSDDWEELSRARERSGTPLPLPFPPSRSGTPYPFP
jgi:hypothetical protein